MRGFIRHELGFAGARRDVALCSVVCVEPETDSACKSVLDGTEMLGTFTGPPDPSLLVRAILFAAERPYAAGALGTAIAIAAVGVILAKRPRPRR